MSFDRPPGSSGAPAAAFGWSPVAFTGETIPEATLLSFLAAARWAPTGLPLQPWRFVCGRRESPDWQSIFESLADYNRGWAQRASALALVLAVPSHRSAVGQHLPLRAFSFDAGAAWVTLAFQATLAGWQALGIGGFDRERARRVLAIPEDQAIEAVIAVGRLESQAASPTPPRVRELASNQALSRSAS